MARPRRQRKRDLGNYVAPVTGQEPPLVDLAEEGVLIAAAGVRLAVKNFIILNSVRDGIDYDPERYRAAVAQELLRLVEEKHEDAERLREIRRAASTRGGRPTHLADYRSIDDDALSRRESLMQLLVRRLRDLSKDSGWIDQLLERARSSALDEIAAAAAPLLGQSDAEDEEYLGARPERLRLLADDLLMLQITAQDEPG